MPINSMTPEELVQHVWVTAGECTELEQVLAERLSQALDALDGVEPGFGDHE